MKMRWLVLFLLVSLLKRLRGDDIYADCVISGHLDKKLCQRLEAAEFEGPIIFKGPSIQEASKDFGGIYHNKPAAVLSPASANDISKLIRIAATSPNLTVAARGNGHSLGGQAMALNGIVVNMTSLTGIVTTYESGVDIPYLEAMAGEFWVDVLRAASEAVGLAPRSWTDYIDLSIGGTLSNAGISGQTFRFGPQISNVLQLEIVTGKGNIITCSEQKHPDLYFGALGGLGQFGVITKARIILERAPQRARWIRLVYWKLQDFMNDQELLISLPPEQTFDFIEGVVVVNANDSINGWPSIPFLQNQSFDTSLIPSTAGPLLYAIEVARYYDPGMDIDKIIESFLSKLGFIKGLQFSKDLSYFDFLYRVHPQEIAVRESGIWYAPHAWLDLFVPKSKMVEFDSKIFKKILIKGVDGLMLVYPVNRTLWDSRTSAVTPDEDIFYVVSLLRFNKPYPKGPPLPVVLDQNNAVLEACRANGIPVKQYLARHKTQTEWEKHFGEQRWKRFVKRKRLFDPKGILAPGQNIFPRLS
eukprot:PITA_01850